MELRVLKYFLIVAREENITRAANLLHVTQPTLSRQLKQMEQELGVELFRRTHHSIILTEDGMLLKRRAQELVSLAEKTRQELSHRNETLSGEIAIGCGETHNMAYLSQLIADCRKAHPLVHFAIYSATADDIKDRIEKGLLDMGLLMEPVEIAKYETIRMPQQEQWGVLVRADSPLATKDSVGPEDLVGVPLILGRREQIKSRLAEWFGGLYEKTEMAATFNLILNAAFMVQSGVGAALCFRLLQPADDLRWVPLLPRLETGSVLVWKKLQPFSSHAARFIEMCRNAL